MSDESSEEENVVVLGRHLARAKEGERRIVAFTGLNYQKAQEMRRAEVRAILDDARL